MFFSFNKNKGRKCLSMQISKKFKRAAVSLSKMCRSKIFVAELPKNTSNYKIFDNSHLEFGKRERAKIKK